MTNGQLAQLLRGEIDSVNVSGKQGAHVIELQEDADTQTVTLYVARIVVQDHQINV
jgi:hypothetical protein